MLRNLIAPSHDFTRIANSAIWDDTLSDAAFRLLVRAIALPEAEVRNTTVTGLAAGLAGGRITADRARKQLQRAGLLHTTKWRGPGGQVRSESLVSSVPLDNSQAEPLFAAHFAGTTRTPPPPPPPPPPPRAPKPPAPTPPTPTAPDAGSRDPRRADNRSSGTALPPGVRQGGNTPPSLPAPTRNDPAAPEAAHPATPHTATAERVLLSLRETDPRLLLGAKELRTLTPLAAEWLLRGVTTEALRAALTLGLPRRMYSAKALLRCRLTDKMPAVPSFAEQAAHAAQTAAVGAAPGRIAPLVDCSGCDAPFRPAAGETRCRSCRQERAAALAARQAAPRQGRRQAPVIA